MPWQNLKMNNRNDKYEKIKEKKLSTSSETLCKGISPQFLNYMNYCKNLKFEDKPDYSYLKGLFKEVFKSSNFELDYAYDWKKIDKKESQEILEKKEEINEKNDEILQWNKILDKAIRKNSKEKNLDKDVKLKKTNNNANLIPNDKFFLEKKKENEKLKKNLEKKIPEKKENNNKKIIIQKNPKRSAPPLNIAKKISEFGKSENIIGPRIVVNKQIN